MKLNERQVVETVGTLSLRELRVWTQKGWIAPVRDESGPLFDDIDIARVRLVCQLRDELELNEEAVPIVLSLMDQLYGLRKELRALVQAVDEQPDDVRRRIRKSFRALARPRR